MSAPPGISPETTHHQVRCRAATGTLGFTDARKWVRMVAEMHEIQVSGRKVKAVASAWLDQQNGLTGSTTYADPTGDTAVANILRLLAA